MWHNICKDFCGGFKMKKKFLLLLSAFLLVLGLVSVSSKTDAATIKATDWGAKKVFTTPKKTRGTWYYKEDKKVKKFKITAYTIDGVKLYKDLNGKTSDKWVNKLIKADKKANYKLADKVGESAWACHTIKYHKITGFNADGWLAGSGDGFYYVPVKKNVKGKKVNALRVGEGAGNYLSYYAYKSRKLVK